MHIANTERQDINCSLRKVWGVGDPGYVGQGQACQPAWADPGRGLEAQARALAAQTSAPKQETQSG